MKNKIIRVSVAAIVALAIFGKVAHPLPLSGFPPVVYWAIVVAESILLVSLLVCKDKKVGVFVILLGLGGWLLMFSGRDCGCFGAKIRLGKSVHLFLSGLLVAAGAHMILPQRAVRRSSVGLVEAGIVDVPKSG